MDEAAIEKAGIAPLEERSGGHRGLKSKAELAALLGRLHLVADAGGMLFGFGSGQDSKNASQVIGFAVAGGLGLPDRDYYLKDDAKSKEVARALPGPRAQDPRAAGRPAGAAQPDAERCCASRPRSPRRRSPASSAAIPTRPPT